MPRIALVQHKAESDRRKNLDRALEAMGVPAQKLVVVPLAYEAPSRAPAPSVPRGELTVLWLGLVNLRKGIPVPHRSRPPTSR